MIFSFVLISLLISHFSFGIEFTPPQESPIRQQRPGTIPVPSYSISSPPQFVLFAFDNCDSPTFWKESLEFADRLDVNKQNLKFTYFVSGAYFLTRQNSHVYAGPRHAPGASDIGFAPDTNFVADRITQINSSLDDDHEIGSHAVGHFEGTKWTTEDWIKEFNLFNHIIMNIFYFNKMTQVPFNLDIRSIVGFRTPYLSYSTGLWPALNKFGYRYDTSKIAPANYWPQKIQGIWNFPLAELTISGTAKKTLSMDYNFYVAQSQAKEDLAHAQEYAQQMYDTYMDYFIRNYNGNRAPVHIGHHFKQMNGGAYWRAMKAVAQTVCSLPSVLCVTYKELADYMDNLTNEQILSFSKGSFIKEPQWLKRNPTEILDLRGEIYFTRDLRMSLKLTGKNAADNSLSLAYLVNGKIVKESLSLDDSLTMDEFLTAADDTSGILTASIRKSGKEVLTISHDVTLGNGTLILSPKLENRILLGDLPEAHEDTKPKKQNPQTLHPSL